LGLGIWARSAICDDAEEMVGMAEAAIQQCAQLRVIGSPLAAIVLSQSLLRIPTQQAHRTPAGQISIALALRKQQQCKRNSDTLT
jgi:hypothetical protein